MQEHWVMRQHNGREYPLKRKRLRLGRDASNDLTLDDLLVSRHHATMWLTAEGWFVRDEGSRNGTLINGERISGSRLLKLGDRLAFGNAIFELARKVNLACETIAVPSVRRTGVISQASLSKPFVLVVSLLALLLSAFSCGVQFTSDLPTPTQQTVNTSDTFKPTYALDAAAMATPAPALTPRSASTDVWHR